MFKSIIRCRAHGYNEITTVKVERDTKKEPFMFLQKNTLTMHYYRYCECYYKVHSAVL